jgi:hypothetical protein
MSVRTITAGDHTERSQLCLSFKFRHRHSLARLDIAVAEALAISETVHETNLSIQMYVVSLVSNH